MMLDEITRCVVASTYDQIALGFSQVRLMDRQRRRSFPLAFLGDNYTISNMLQSFVDAYTRPIQLSRYLLFSFRCFQ